MTDGLVPVAPLVQPGVDAVLVGVHESAFRDARLDHGPDRRLLHVGQHPHDHLAATLEPAQDGRLVLRQRAASGRPPQPPPARRAPPLAASAGPPLGPATTEASPTATFAPTTTPG